MYIQTIKNGSQKKCARDLHKITIYKHSVAASSQRSDTVWQELESTANYTASKNKISRKQGPSKSILGTQLSVVCGSHDFRRTDYATVGAPRLFCPRFEFSSSESVDWSTNLSTILPINYSESTLIANTVLTTPSWPLIDLHYICNNRHYLQAHSRSRALKRGSRFFVLAN